MARRKVTRNRFECGHKGRGKNCHRCEQAGGFQFYAESSDSKYVTGKKNADVKKHKVWTKAECRAEAERLLQQPVVEAFNV